MFSIKTAEKKEAHSLCPIYISGSMSVLETIKHKSMNIS
jgi:hypothetical protein